MDKRLSPRLLADNEVVISVENEQGEIISERTMLSDVSADGLNFITRHHSRYSSGQPVRLQIQMPGDEAQEDIISYGRVIWLSDPDISTCGEAIQPRVGVSISQGDISRLVNQ